jgi:hypothetical protein
MEHLQRDANIASLAALKTLVGVEYWWLKPFLFNIVSGCTIEEINDNPRDSRFRLSLPL